MKNGERLMIHTNRYAGLMSLYTQIQNAKYHHINPAEIFNSRLHDSFMHMEINGADITGIYSRKSSTITIPEREITDAITDVVNFGNVNCPGGWPGDLLDRFEAFAATLPPMRLERATELKAVGNHINFQKGLYYKFTDENGKTRVLASTGENKLSLLETDVLAGRVDGENWCEPGDIVEGNNGRQFVVNQDGKIDVQYGDDVLSLHPLKVIGHVDM